MHYTKIKNFKYFCACRIVWNCDMFWSEYKMNKNNHTSSLPFWFWHLEDEQLQTKDREAGTSRTAGHCQLRELLFLWQQLSAFLSARLPSQDRSTVSEHSGSERSRQYNQYIHPKEIRSQAKLTVLLSKTSSSTGSRRISCRTRAETVTTPSAHSHLGFQPVREDRTFTSL